MAEVTISARVPEALEKDLMEFVEKESVDKSVDRSIAVRKLLSSELQKWKEETALRLLGEGKVTLSRAAKLAGMGIWDFTEKVRQSQLVWVKLRPEELRRELRGL